MAAPARRSTRVRPALPAGGVARAPRLRGAGRGVRCVPSVGGSFARRASACRAPECGRASWAAGLLRAGLPCGGHGGVAVGRRIAGSAVRGAPTAGRGRGRVRLACRAIPAQGIDTTGTGTEPCSVGWWGLPRRAFAQRAGGRRLEGSAPNSAGRGPGSAAARRQAAGSVVCRTSGGPGGLGRAAPRRQPCSTRGAARPCPGTPPARRQQGVNRRESTGRSLTCGLRCPGRRWSRGRPADQVPPPRGTWSFSGAVARSGRWPRARSSGRSAGRAGPG